MSTKEYGKRLFEVDCIKFFAIIFMVWIHVYEQFGKYDYREVMPDTLARNFLEFVGGPLAAPVFMFCMGMGMIYTRKQQVSDFVSRGLKLMVTGYLLNFFRQTLLQLIGMMIGVETDMEIMGGLLNVDILQFAGMAYLTVGIMKKCKLSRFQMLGVCVCFQMLGIWGTKLKIASITLQNIIGLFLPTGKWVAFPLTIWLVYPVTGMLFAELINKTNNKELLYRRLLLTAVLFFSAYTSCLFYVGYDIRKFFSLYCDFYYHQTFLSLLWVLPLILISLCGCYFAFEKIKENKIGKYIAFSSINLNKIYIFQWMIIAYVKAITIMIGKELNLSAYVILILGSFIMIMSCCTVCFKYGRDI